MREYDLLAGILAFQLRLVSTGTLAWYARAAGEAPETHLFDFLAEKGAMATEDWKLLRQITEELVRAHQGNAAAALESFGGAGAAERAFARTIQKTAAGWETSEDETVVASELPHGLPPQIVPESIGRYTRGSEYARGGIGRVLLVHDEQIGRDVILKELLPHRETSPTDPTLSRMPSPASPIRQSAAMVSRFLQEAKITGQLEHPSIVPVYELGLRKDGKLYYTMKLVRGNTLAVAIGACRTLDDRLGLLRFYLDVCQAIAYAHAKGVIHRDLKPSNIMVGEFGECVVLDWGLAKTQKDPDVHREAMEKTLSQLNLPAEHLEGLRTGSREVLGTPLYMAPEQARGEIDTVGYHSDVYSLGVLLFEILSGSIPHPWTNSHDTVQRVGKLPAPPVESAAPETPPELAAICNKALQFEAKDRYASARDLANDIERYLTGALVDAYAYRVSDVLRRLYRRHKPMIYTAGLAVATVIAVGTLSYINIYRARENEALARGLAETQRGVAETQRAEAEAQRDEANTQRARAETAEELTAREKYVSDIRLASAYLLDFKFQAAEDTLLAADPRYRGMEWGHLLAECHQDWATIHAHDLDIRALLSPDGTRVLTLSSDLTAKLWDTASRQLLYTWSLPDSLIASGAFSPDGDRVAIWMRNGSIHLFDTASGTAQRNWAAHEMRVHQMAFSRDGQWIASAAEDRLVRAWNVETGELRWEAGPFEAPVYQLVYAPDDRAVLACPAGGAPALLDSASGATQATAPLTGRVYWTDGNTAVVGEGADLVFLAGPGLEETRRIPAGMGISLAVYYPETGALLAGTNTGLVTWWDVPSGQLRQTCNFMHPVHDCRISGAGDTIIAVSVSGHIATFDKATGAQRLAFGGHRHNVTSVGLVPQDTYLLTASVDGTAKFWSLRAPGTSIARARPPEGFHTLALSENGSTMLLGANGGRLAVLDLDRNAPLLHARFPHQSSAPPSSLSGDGRLLATVLDGFLPAVISVNDPAATTAFSGHAGEITSAGFNLAGTELITASWDNTARIWDVVAGTPLGTLDGHLDTVYTAVFSPDGSLVATGSRDGTAKVWDRESLATRFTIPQGHAVHSCAFSPDGTLVATSGHGGTIRIWDVAHAAERHALYEQSAHVRGLAFSPDGRRLLSQAQTNAITVWDSLLGLRLSDLPPGGGLPGTWARYHAPQGTLLAGAADGVIREIRPLTETSGAPITDAAALAQALDAYRRVRDASPPPPDPIATQLEANVYLPAPRLAALLERLGVMHGARPDPVAAWQLDTGLPEFHPVELLAGDTITAIASMAPAAFFRTGNAQGLERYAAGDHIASMDFIRDGLLTRLLLHGIPVRETTRTVTLSPERAADLLRAARETIQRDATTLDQVTRQQATPGADTPNGIQVPTPRDTARKALLLEAGLQANTRLVAVNGEPVTGLEDLAARLDAGIAYLEYNTSFSVRLRLERGAFEVEDVAIEGGSGL